MRLFKFVFSIAFVMIVFNQSILSQVNSNFASSFSELRKNHFDSFSKMVNVEGDYFIDKDWSDGIVYFNNNHVIKNVSLRFFIYGNEMHVKNDGVVNKIINQNVIDSIVFDGHRFIFTKLHFGNNLIDVYVDFLSGTNIKLYKYYTNKFIKARDVSGYQKQEIDKYIVKREYYVCVGDAAAELFTPKKRTILNLFSDKEEIIKKFVKRNRLKYTKEDDFIKIFDFYSSL
ncbi:hypothetical protein L3073_00625 [Ancylomarina sp. DW003]|nr:hypothetical protein [Ancylomarina sp. DW003]MDE5420702.1 hypothetical protein [Ancylomarina sp. DW003]